MEQRTNSVDETDSRDRILPLLSESGDRRLVTEWIEGHPSYEPVDLTGSLEDTAFDVCILDEGAFREHLPSLRAKKSAASPVVLPYLLLLDESDPDIIDMDSGGLADNAVTESIDEIVTMPIQQAELHWRLAALLRLREQSLTLRQRERNLERQVDLFEKAQDIADVGAWEYDLRTDEHPWTEEVYRIYDLPADRELTPEESIEHYHPDDQDTIREAFWRAVEESEPYDVELRLITAKGDQRWVRTRGEPQQEDGEVFRVRGTIQDITDRKERERVVQQTRDQYRTIFEASNDTILIIDPNADEILAANPQASDLFGYDAETLLDEVSPSEIHEAEIDQFRQFVNGVLETGDGWTDELTCTRWDGRSVPAEISASRIEFEGRQCLLASIRDISARKAKERENSGASTRLLKPQNTRFSSPILTGRSHIRTRFSKS
jgi:PAS domain S-box-containing protein